MKNSPPDSHHITLIDGSKIRTVGNLNLIRKSTDKKKKHVKNKLKIHAKQKKKVGRFQRGNRKS